MKRVNIIITLVTCFAALLTSCIKEGPYAVERVDLKVNITRGSEGSQRGSQQQGDKIENVMIWAFRMTGGAVSNASSGWRTYTPSGDTFNSVTVHLELPLCEDSEAYYRLVAIINKDEFGKIVDADGEDLALNAGTSYNDLISARFVSDVVNESLSEAPYPGTPDVMPVSHWIDVKVVNPATNNTVCQTIDGGMPVYRAVAKTQLFIARNSQFQLELHDVTLVNAAAEAQGVVLSQTNNVSTPSWFVQNPTLTKGSYSSQLIASSNIYKISPDDATFIYNDNSTLKNAANGHDVAHYVCGKVIYETPSVCTYNDATYQDTPEGSGYYYKIRYKIGNNGDPITRYVPLPAIVRNHDYQVRVFVREDDGGIEVNYYTVDDWEDIVWDLAFDAAQHTSLLPMPDANAKSNTYPTVRYVAGSEEGAAVFFFKMIGPEGITWKPTLRNVSPGDYVTRVYEVTSINTDTNGNVVGYTLGSTPVTGDIEATGDKFYAIKVVDVNPNDVDRVDPVKLGVTHAPQWNEEKSNLLVINPGSAESGFWWYAKDNNGNPSNKVGDPLEVCIYPVQ